MSRILVTGATGFIGAPLARMLEGRGHVVIRGVRNAPTADGSASVSLADLTREGGAFPAVDVVIHLAARAHVRDAPGRESAARYREVNVAMTRRLAQAAARHAQRFVLVSSIGVNGSHTRGEPFHESDLPAPIEEYARSKWEAELALADVGRRTGLQTVIVRPSLVYGPGVKGNLLRLLQLLASGIPVPLRGLSAPRNFAGLSNLCDLLCRCAEHPGAANQLFLAADPEPRSSGQLIEALAAGMGAHSVRIPERVLAAIAWLCGRSADLRKLSAELRVDSTKAMRLLQWQSPVSFEEEIAQLLEWFRGPR